MVLMIKSIPLHNLGGFEIRKRIIEKLNLNRKLCDGIPGISKEYKNLVEKITVAFWINSVVIYSSY